MPHKPSSNQYGLAKPISLQLVKKFEPKQAWLAHKSYLHGVDHMARVFILQELICDKLQADGIAVDREALRWASMAHDVRRVNDGVDLSHGWRSAKWITDNLLGQMSPELLDTVTYIVHWHVPQDGEAPALTTELKVLKDADGLDRVRLGDLDRRFIRTDAAMSLISLADDLYQTYLVLETHTKGSFSAVVKAAQKLGLIEPNG